MTPEELRAPEAAEMWKRSSRFAPARAAQPYTGRQ